MHSTHVFPLLCIIGLLWSGCVREVGIDLPEQPSRIVALSHFSPGEPFRVEVSLSQSLTDAGDPALPFNADVSIAIEGKFLDKLFRVSDNSGRIYWESRDLVLSETPYSLSVRIPGKEPVEALSSAPAPAQLEQIRIDTARMQIIELADGKRALRVPLQIVVANLPAEKRYFAFSLRHEIQVFEIIDGQPVPGTVDEYKEEATKFLADGRTLALVYDTPESVVLVNENYWSDNNNVLAVDAQIPFDPKYEKPSRVFVEWRTLSEEFYRYHLSLARQSNNLPLSDPDALYNNIIGGYGNFSGFSSSTSTLTLPE